MAKISVRSYLVSGFLHGSMILLIWLGIRHFIQLPQAAISISIAPIWVSHPVPITTGTTAQPRPKITTSTNLANSPEKSAFSQGEEKISVPSSAVMTYLAAIREKILSHQRYPIAARRRRESALIEVKVRLSANGLISEKTIIYPGKSQILEEAALQAIEEAQPFPPVPSDFSGEFVVPIDFRIQ